MSRSRLIPGKTRMADFILEQLNPVILDHGIRQQLVGGIFQRRLGLGLVGAGQFDIEHLALAHAGDAIDAERFQRAFDGVALRIENAGLECNGDARFHLSTLTSLAALLRERYYFTLILRDAGFARSSG